MAFSLRWRIIIMISPPKKFRVKSSISALSITLILSSITLLSGQVHADQVYGPVRSNDTLSKIVNRYYVGSERSSITLMRTIVQNNPQAFVRGDMNLLKRNALLTLPGDDWLVNEATFISPGNQAVSNSVTPPVASSVERPSTSSNKLGVQDRLFFLEAERVSLIAEVAELKRENERLQKKVTQLELQSKQSDEQLRLLDAEIIRLTKLLGDKQSAPLTSADLNQLEALQLQLEEVKTETNRLRSELAVAQSELSENRQLKQQADKTIAQLERENEQLNKLVNDTQPGVHYYGEEEASSSKLTLFGNKLQLPVWSIITGGALLLLILVTLLATRRKEYDGGTTTPLSQSQPEESFENLLESEVSELERGFVQTSVAEPEENVYKMFDEGSLEMDLKLDMAKAYLEVSDFTHARAVLEEVIEGGSEHQQRQAKRLMTLAA
ncbi:hypothetical protein EOL70_01880 [Leucothrix sargassi]|nr:hypothetical protein EOL70_01880 [Leucothrix sargassi]